MSKLVITGGARLRGEIAVEGSKNAVLPILAASLLNGGESIIKNCPRLRDVEVMVGILRKIGCRVKVEDDVIIVNSSDIRETQIPVELAAEMRSSIIFMGPMLARCGRVTISYPGGCVTLWAYQTQTQPGHGSDTMSHFFAECGLKIVVLNLFPCSIYLVFLYAVSRCFYFYV